MKNRDPFYSNGQSHITMLEFHWIHAHQIGPKPIPVAMGLKYSALELGPVPIPNAIHPPKENLFLLLDEGRMILGKQQLKLFTPA